MQNSHWEKRNDKKIIPQTSLRRLDLCQNRKSILTSIHVQIWTNQLSIIYIQILSAPREHFTRESQQVPSWNSSSQYIQFENNDKRYHLCQERGEQARRLLLPPHFEGNRYETRSDPQLPLNGVTATSPNIKSNYGHQLVWHVGTHAKQGQSLRRCW